MSNKHLYWLTGFLCLFSVGLFLYKSMVLKFPIFPAAQTRVWNIEARIQFHPAEGPVKVQLFIPSSSSRFTIADEEFVSLGYGLGIKHVAGNRQAIWSKRDSAREQVIYYKATVRPSTEPVAATVSPPKVIETGYVEAQLIAAQAIVAEAKSKSADVETLVHEIIARLNSAGDKTNTQTLKILLPEYTSTLQRLEVATQLLALEKIPARIVRGIQLVDSERNAKEVLWLEVYHQHAWQSYAADTGLPEVPANYLPWWHGNKTLVRLAGGKIHSVKTAVSRNEESALISALWREKATRPILHGFSLLSLPLDTQAVYRVLLTVPIGVLLLVLLRNIVGIKTFGTFMPVLIAMAFRETQLLWGIVLFTVVVGLGLAIRHYLEQLKLLLVPRLAAVLITVIIIMLAISLLSHKLGFHYGLSVALFPMVILTMTIERTNIIWEERGANEAMKQAIGSLIVASLAYLVMNIELVEYLLFIFPELLFFILAVTLLLGRYSGYRLLELYRFKALTSGQQ